MPNKIVEALVEGGKASAAPPLGPALGPIGVNIGQVISTINQKTKDFQGMKVPIKVIVKEDKSFTIEIGTPPVSQLIMKELNLQKGSGMPNREKVGNLAVEQVIKIASMKRDSMFVNNLKSAVKSVAGSANSMGLLVEGKLSNEFNLDIESGMFDNEINSEKIEFTEEKRQLLQQQLETVQKQLKAELEKLKALEEAEKAKETEKKEVVAGEEKVAEEKPEEKKGIKEEKKPEAKEEKKEEKKKR